MAQFARQGKCPAMDTKCFWKHVRPAVASALLELSRAKRIGQEITHGGLLEEIPICVGHQHHRVQTELREELPARAARHPPVGRSDRDGHELALALRDSLAAR